ncbi:MAG: hypothetical protein ACTSX1_09370 [Candidatus Heimdallarchaeaceae archaeon]
MRKNMSVLFLIPLFLVGCGSTPDLQMDSRPVPNVYSMSTFHSSGITANFVCVLGIGEKDMDGSFVEQPEYLMADVPREIRFVKTKAVHFQIAVYNPLEIKYRVEEEYTIEYKGGAEVQGQGVAGYSHLKNREFYRKLPIAEDIDRVTYRIILKNEKGEEILRAGDFIYRLL